MEIQKKNQEIDIKRLPTSEIEKVILEGISIKDLKNDEAIRANLRRSFVLIGISGDQIPIEAEKQLLIASIRKNYPRLKAEEIGIAFEMLSCDKLTGVKKTLFNKVFSFSYFSSVMNAYIDQKRNQIITDMNQRNSVLDEPTDDEKRQYQIKYVENCVIAPIEQYKETGVLDFGNVSIHRVYDIFKKSGLINLSESKRSEMFSRHYKEVSESWRELVDNKSETQEQYELKSKIRSALNEDDKTTLRDEVNIRCKKDAIIQCIESYETHEIDEKLKSII